MLDSDGTVDPARPLPHRNPSKSNLGLLQGRSFGLGREHETQAREVLELLGRRSATVVGVGGPAEPGPALQHPEPGGGQEPHLRGELPGLAPQPGDLKIGPISVMIRVRGQRVLRLSDVDLRGRLEAAEPE